MDWLLGFIIHEEERMAQLTQKQFEELAAANPGMRAQLEEAGLVKPLSPTGRNDRYDPPIQMLPTRTGRWSYANVPSANAPRYMEHVPWMKPEEKVEIRFLLWGWFLKAIGSILGSQAVKQSAENALDKAEPNGKDIRPR